MPDDANGERFLHAFLLKSLPATQVLDVAPCGTPVRVDHNDPYGQVDRRIPDADLLGELIEFSFDDLKAMKRAGYSVRHIAPFDAQR